MTIHNRGVLRKPIIELKNVSFKYSGEKREVLRNVNLSIWRGEYIIVAGPSGCGKTTLARVMTGLIPHFYNGNLSGSIYVYGRDTREMTVRDITKVVGYVSQNPEDQILLDTVIMDVSLRLQYSGLAKEAIIDKVYEVTDKLGISHLLYRNVNSLSGGELQKVAIAGILISKPEVIILDEPTAYLSPKSVIELMYLIDDLIRKFNLTVIIIDHKLDLILRKNARVIIMYNGEVILDSNVIDALKEPLDEKYGINIPTLTRLAHILKKQFNVKVPTYYPDLEAFMNVVIRKIMV